MIKKNFNFFCKINFLQLDKKNKICVKKFIFLTFFISFFFKLKKLYILNWFKNLIFLFYVYIILKYKIISNFNIELKKKFNFNKFVVYNNTKKKLSLKIIRLKLEKIIYLTTSYNVNISLIYIFDIFKLEDKIIFEKTQLLRYSRFFFFYDFVHFFFFSVYFKKSFLLAKFISKNITNNKKSHFSFLKKIKRLSIRLLLYGFFYDLVGLKISVHGKFQGKLRKRRFKFFWGKSSLTSILKVISYDLQQSYTKFGVFSIKVWMFFYCKVGSNP